MSEVILKRQMLQWGFFFKRKKGLNFNVTKLIIEVSHQRHTIEVKDLVISIVVS